MLEDLDEQFVDVGLRTGLLTEVAGRIMPTTYGAGYSILKDLVKSIEQIADGYRFPLEQELEVMARNAELAFSYLQDTFKAYHEEEKED